VGEPARPAPAGPPRKPLGKPVGAPVLAAGALCPQFPRRHKRGFWDSLCIRGETGWILSKRYSKGPLCTGLPRSMATPRSHNVPATPPGVGDRALVRLLPTPSNQPCSGVRLSPAVHSGGLGCVGRTAASLQAEVSNPGTLPQGAAVRTQQGGWAKEVTQSPKVSLTSTVGDLPRELVWPTAGAEVAIWESQGRGGDRTASPVNGTLGLPGTPLVLLQVEHCTSTLSHQNGTGEEACPWGGSAMCRGVRGRIEAVGSVSGGCPGAVWGVCSRRRGRRWGTAAGGAWTACRCATPPRRCPSPVRALSHVSNRCARHRQERRGVPGPAGGAGLGSLGQSLNPSPDPPMTLDLLTLPESRIRAREPGWEASGANPADAETRQSLLVSEFKSETVGFKLLLRQSS